jgi:putative thioredoxin
VAGAGAAWPTLGGAGDNLAMTQPSFSTYGAVDLGALAQRGAARPAPSAGAAAGATGPYVVHVTEATFQAEVLERSLSVPVVVDFWAEWCGPCKQLSPALERLAAEYAGRFVLAKVDVDANEQLSAAAQIQSIPTVLGVIKGQAVPLFQGALPEAQVRQYVDQLLQVAAANGVAGVAEPAAGRTGSAETPEATEPTHDPRYDTAYDAIERGDLDAAAAAYEALLAETPADEEARLGLAQVDLMRRTEGLDESAARASADSSPDDVDAALLVADLDVLAGRPEDAFARVVELVRRTSGDDRDRARSRLLELFGVVGQDDPRVAKARVALASALF